MWTACGDSICRAYDAKSGTLKRSYVGHEAAVNCMVITEGKLYTGSSDGTLRIWDAKETHIDIDGQPSALRFIEADLNKAASCAVQCRAKDELCNVQLCEPSM